MPGRKRRAMVHGAAEKHGSRVYLRVHLSLGERRTERYVGCAIASGTVDGIFRDGIGAVFDLVPTNFSQGDPDRRWIGDYRPEQPESPSENQCRGR